MSRGIFPGEDPRNPETSREETVWVQDITHEEPEGNIEPTLKKEARLATIVRNEFGKVLGTTFHGGGSKDRIYFNDQIPTEVKGDIITFEDGSRLKIVKKDVTPEQRKIAQD
jgi:hypothetical protein